MRFGGHETFHLRDGWLHKGLRLLKEAPEAFNSSIAADALGVGGNMAKSIRHWLLATGLVAKGETANSALSATKLGLLVFEHDRYFTDT